MASSTPALREPRPGSRRRPAGRRAGRSARRIGCVSGISKLALLPILLSALAFIAISIPAADWPTHRGDLGRTGFNNANLPLPLQALWSHTLAPPRPAWGPPARRSYWQRLDHLAARVADDHSFVPILAGDALLCGSSADDHLRCFEASSGQLRWLFPTDGPVRYAPTVADGLVYFGSDDGWIRAVRLHDGSLAWRYRPGPEDRRIPGNGRLISTWPIRTGLLVDDGTVFATAGLYPHQGTFACALNAADGASLWQVSLDASPEGYLLATDPLVIIPTGRASPIGLDRQTGRVVRTFDTGGGTYAVVSQGEIFGGPGNQGSLTGVAAQSGQRLLTVQGRNLVAAGPRLFLLERGRLKAVDRARQAILQRTIRELESRIRTSQAQTNADPHSHRDALARLGDTLALARRDLDACELWTTSCPEDLCLIGTGNALLAGGTNRVAAFDPATGRRLWDAPVRGRALALAASSQHLVVATDTGELHVFGATREPPPPAIAQQLPNDPPLSRPTEEAGGKGQRSSFDLLLPSIQTLLSAGLAPRGYALVAGFSSGQLITDLLARTDLHVVAIDPDSNKVARARNEWLPRGVYGSRLSLHTVPPGALPFTDFFANLVVSESRLEGKGPPAWSPTELQRVTRPFGGLQWTGSQPVPSRRGPLEGSGEWTHQFANPANTASSGDTRIHARLALQWFGGPGPDLMVDRHLRGPAPLSSQGRLIVPGENLLVAVDAYNGTPLWQRELPGSQRYTMPYDAGYLSLSSNTLAVAVRDTCWLIDAADGSLRRQWPAPALEGGVTNPHWGYTVLLGDRLWGTTQWPSASRTQPSYEQIDVDYNNDQPLVTGLSSFLLDATTGRTLWHRQGGVLINTTLTLSANRFVFVESRNPELLRHPTGRIPLTQLLAGNPWLVALDAQSGEVIWEKPILGPLAHSRNVLYLTSTPDKLIVLGSHRDPSNDTRYTVEARNLADGSVLWTADHLARVPGEYTHGEQVHHPVILGDLLVAEPAVYELATGRRLTDSGGAEPWNLIRPGHSCGTLSAAGDCLFFRAGNPTVMDLRANLRSAEPPAKLSPSRTGCWINMIPAGGLLMIPEASAGCVCQFSLQTSMAFLPRSP